jgi:hypothetical protein
MDTNKYLHLSATVLDVRSNTDARVVRVRLGLGPPL